RSSQPLLLLSRPVFAETAGSRLEFHDDGLHLGVLLQPIFAEFTSNAGLLEAAEWSPGIEDVVAVHPDSPGSHAVRDRMRLFDIAGPNGRRQSIVRAVCPCDNLLDILERDDTHH